MSFAIFRSGMMPHNRAALAQRTCDYREFGASDGIICHQIRKRYLEHARNARRDRSPHPTGFCSAMRISMSSWPMKVGLSPSPCLRRVKLLEDRGIIDQYTVVLNGPAIGLSLTVFAASGSDAGCETTNQFAETVRKFPGGGVLSHHRSATPSCGWSPRTFMPIGASSRII